MDRLRDIDLNSFPFKLRFSPTNKVYKEILSISSEIHASFLKLNREIHDKNEIKNIIRDHFAFIKEVLRKTVQYYDSESCPNVSEEEKFARKKQMEEKLLCYYEDEQEISCFERIKPITVNVSSVPSHWKCLTWKKFSTSKVDNNQQRDSADRIKQMTKADKVSDNDNLDQFADDLEEICSSIRTLSHQVQLLQSKLNLLNDYIIRLYLNFKNNLRVLVKFNRQFTTEDVENDSRLQSIKNDVATIFEIEQKVDFFSKSPSAYHLKINNFESIHIQLKTLEAASNCVKNTDVNSNYIGEVYSGNQSGVQ